MVFNKIGVKKKKLFLLKTENIEQQKRGCKMMKFFMCLCILTVVVFAFPVFAQTEADFRVTRTGDGQGIIINGYSGNATEVTIPSTIQGLPVQEIGDAAFAGWASHSPNTTLTTINLPDSITKIGAEAFQYCIALTTVTMPISLTSIGEGAFMECTALTTVTFPASIGSIGAGAFYGCTALTTITIPASVARIDFQFSGILGYAFGGSGFSGCPNLTPASREALRRVGLPANPVRNH